MTDTPYIHTRSARNLAKALKLQVDTLDVMRTDFELSDNLKMRTLRDGIVRSGIRMTTLLNDFFVQGQVT